MYGMPGMPAILISSGPLQTQSASYNQGQAQGLEDESSFTRSSTSARLHQRAPKLGQIGRSRRVVIEDEDLDDMLNNNGRFPLTANLSPVA